MSFEVIKDKVSQYPLACMCGIASLLLVGLIFINHERLPGLRESYAELEKVKRVLDYNLVNGYNLDNDLKMEEMCLKDIESQLMDPDRRADNYHYFFALEDRTGAKIENPRQVGVEPVMEDEGKKVSQEVAVTKFKLQAVGQYKDLLMMIYELQTGHYLARIKNFEIYRKDSMASESLLMNMDVSFFGKPD